jgi:acyl carrier protein
VEFQLKRGESRNEMSCFRYDAIITLDGKPLDDLQPERSDWQDINDFASLRSQVTSSISTSGSSLIVGIPDARLRPEMIAMSKLAIFHSDADSETVADITTAVSQDTVASIQPESLYQLAAELKLNIQLIGTAPGRFNALFHSAENSCDGRFMLPTRDLTLKQCCNNPMQGRMQRKLVPALKDHLRVSLPDYMVPAVFSILEAFPLTPNGKIDRKALPAPDQGHAQTYTPPRTPTEEALVSIWENLLGVGQVGVLDDFFGLGGHSLLATQLISRIRDQLDVSLPLNSLFDNPTVAGLATATDTIRWALSDNGNDNMDNDNLEEIEI